MTKRRGNLGWGSLLVVFVGLGLLPGCSGNDKKPEEEASGVVTELKSDVARETPDASEALSAGQSQQEFAFSFLHALDAEENLAFSPHSLSTAFAMATDAASGQTLNEIEQTLKFGAADEAFHRSQDALGLALAQRNRDAIDTSEQKVEAQILQQSNDVWIRDDMPPQASFLDTLARFYGVGVHHAEFATRPEEVRLAINAKVSQDTHDLIPELIPKRKITTDTVSVLTNALYFKAPWQNPFAAPTPGDFHLLDGTVQSAEMLRGQSHLRYAAGEGFVSVAVPYFGGELEMLLIVPDSGKYESVRAALSSDLLSQLVTDGKSEDIALTLPKFNIKSIVPAMKTLRDLGMLTPFRQSAEFPKLVSEQYPSVYITDVLHQATVAIDEKGTEASAATAIIFGRVSSNVEPPEPKLVTIDRPFLFTIRDNPTGAVLFVGQIVEP